MTRDRMMWIIVLIGAPIAVLVPRALGGGDQAIGAAGLALVILAMTAFALYDIAPQLRERRRR